MSPRRNVKERRDSRRCRLLLPLVTLALTIFVAPEPVTSQTLLKDPTFSEGALVFDPLGATAEGNGRGSVFEGIVGSFLDGWENGDTSTWW